MYNGRDQFVRFLGDQFPGNSIHRFRSSPFSPNHADFFSQTGDVMIRSSQTDEEDIREHPDMMSASEQEWVMEKQTEKGR